MGNPEQRFSREAAIHAALGYLERQAQHGRFPCSLSVNPNMTSPQPCPSEVGSSMLVLGTALKQVSHPLLQNDTTKYLTGQIDDGVFHYFENPELLPSDADTTSYGVSTLYELGKITKKELLDVADKIERNLDMSGKVKIYFEPSKKQNKLEVTATTNIMYLMGLANKRQVFARSEDWVMETLVSREYLKGSEYYHSPDRFLYYIARACQLHDIGERFTEPTVKALKERIGTTQSPLDLAMRVTIAKRLGVDNSIDESSLLKLQNVDSSFPSDAIYRGSNFGYVGSAVISTAFAIEALAMK